MKERGETLRCFHEAHGLQHLFITGELEFFKPALLCLFGFRGFEPFDVLFQDDRLAEVLHFFGYGFGAGVGGLFGLQILPDGFGGVCPIFAVDSLQKNLPFLERKGRNLTLFP